MQQKNQSNGSTVTEHQPEVQVVKAPPKQQHPAVAAAAPHPPPPVDPKAEKVSTLFQYPIH